MKYKIAIFLIISSMLWFLFELNGIIYRNLGPYAEGWFLLVASFIILLQPIGFALLGFTYVKPNPPLRKKTAAVFTVLSGLTVILLLYFRVIYFNVSYFNENPLRFILDYTVNLFPISVLIFWIMLVRGNVRKGAVWLLVGALLSTLSIFSDKLVLTFTYGYDFDRGAWETVSQILRMLNIFYPISLIAFAVSVLQSEKTQSIDAIKQQAPHHPDGEILDNLPPEPQFVKTAGNAANKNPAVIDWLADFLAAMVPLFGLGFLVWRGQNKKDVFRRNWAAASLFWTIIGSAIALWLYAPIFQLSDQLKVILGLIIIVLASLFIFWILIVRKINADDFDDENEDTMPSVLTWAGWVFMSFLSVVGLVFLIVWAMDRQNQVRRNWAIARLIWVGIMIVYTLFLLMAYSDILQYNARFVHFQF